MNLVLVAALVAVGISVRSIGVLAEGVDYLADAAAIGVSIFAIWLSARSTVAGRTSVAAEVAALVNAGWLFLLCLFVTIGAVARVASGPPEVRGLPVLVVSGIAAVAMSAGALILRGDDDEHDVNLRAVLLDTAGDAAAAGGVALAGGIIIASGGNYWLDPTVALAVALVVGFHAAKLIVEVVQALRAQRGGGASAR